MNTNIKDVADSLTNFLKDEANTGTIVGKEFKLGEFTCVPVMRIGMGLGYGGGEGHEEKKIKAGGEGVGGGAAIPSRRSDALYLQSQLSQRLSCYH